MNLLVCVFTFTIFIVVLPPVVKSDQGPPPLITKGNSPHPFYKPKLRRNILPLHLHPNQKYLNPVHIPKKIHNLKLLTLPFSDKRHLRANQQNINNDWTPISPNVVDKKSYTVPLPRTFYSKQRVSVPIKPTRDSILPRRSGIPVAVPIQQPSQTKNVQYRLNDRSNKVVPDSAIKPKIIYNPFSSNNEKKSPNKFLANSYGHSIDPFFVLPTQQTLSPIFASSSTNDNPEASRKAFLENFDFDQFFEQQKALSSSPRQRVPDTRVKNTPLENYFEDYKTAKENYDPENYQRDYSHLLKNYRDDKTHEPSVGVYYETNDVPQIERGEDEAAPRISQDTAKDVPTKPIYPGEGQWAKPGIKHRPYIGNHKYDVVEESSEKPDGYETFLQGNEFFNVKREKFQNQLNVLPVNHNLGQFLSTDKSNQNDNTHQEQNEETSAEEEEEQEEFTPMKLYAQVRHSDNEEHLPPEEGEGGRLKEVIRDSKSQTVYTEEGYEDVGYDHEGHEKVAEEDEGFEEADTEVQKAEEKKVPLKKYNGETSSYTKGDKLITDEEIKTDKASLGILADSDSAGTQYAELPIVNVAVTHKPRKKKKDKASEKKKHNMKDFISTKETKTMTTKDNDDGNMEMEITGEVKVIMQPNNSSKSQEFVKKLPTIHKIMKSENEAEENMSDVRVEEIQPEIKKDSMKNNGSISNMEEFFTQKLGDEIPPTTYLPSELDSLEIPVTTLPTTAIPVTSDSTSSDSNELTKIDGAFDKTNTQLRKKRFTNDFPKISVETDFISKIKHDLGPSKPDLTFIKYPYYKDFKNIGLNENSPLRYAEDMGNIPNKKEGNMAFYEQAESRITCPEIASTVEPIPERILNAENQENEEEEDAEENESENESDYDEEESEVQEQPKTPRLSGLGDKIECLRTMYFGENPLDSPFFKEETVGPVVPIFNDLKTIFFQNRKTSQRVLADDTFNEEVDQKLGQSSHNLKVSPQIRDNGETGKLLAIEEQPKHVVTEENSHEEFSTTFIPLVIDNGNIGAKIQQKYFEQLENITYATSPEQLDESKPSTPPYKIDLSDETKVMMNAAQKQNDILTPLRPEVMNNSTPRVLEKPIEQLEKETTSKFSVSRNVIRPTEASLITTPNYKIDLKPKNIYDQIHLLNYLPDKNNDTLNTINAPHSELLKTPKAEMLVKWENKIFDSERTPKKLYEESENDALDAEALTLKRRRRVRIKPRPPLYPIVDMNKYIPTTQYPVFGHFRSSRPTTLAPKSMLMSEVFYKNNIKPNEQMNVFTDILNNIKTSSEDKIENANVPETPNINNHNQRNNLHNLRLPQSPVVKPQKTYGKNSHGKDSYLDAYQNMEVDTEYFSAISTSPKSLKVSYSIGTYEVTEAPFITARPTKVIKFGNKKRLVVFLPPTVKPIATLTTTQKPQLNITTRKNISFVEGLLPPRPQNIVHAFKRDNAIFESNQEVDTADNIVNKFLFMGMKPPPMQKIYVYSDFIHKYPNRNRKYTKRRVKRSTSRMGYASLSRRKSSEEATQKSAATTEADDDYVPHRSKNYYYDEKLGKIVYLNKIKNEEEELEEEVPEEVVYEEAVQERKRMKSTTPKQNPIFATATPPPEGQSYIDFVKKLKSASNYHEIPDPVSTKVSPVEITTPKLVPTTPPEFLNILARVHSDDHYKVIQDPDKNKSNRKPSTLLPVEDVEELSEEEEDYQDENVKNSRDGMISKLRNDFNIFDITEYIPKLKNYLPKTAIDTSKYKTIERATQKSTPVEQATNIAMESSKFQQEITPNPISSESKLKIIVEDTLNKETIPVEASTVPTVSSTPLIPGGSGKRAPVIRTRGRRPSRTTISTPSPLSTTVPVQTSTRKRLTRFRTRSTTEKYFDEVEENSTKHLRRRSNTEEEEKSNSDEVHEIVAQKNDRETKKIDEVNRDVKVLKKYDPNAKHGGNYRGIFGEQDLVNNQQDILGDSESNQSLNPQKAREATDAIVFIKYDDSHSHGGNYRKVGEGTIVSNNGRAPVNNVPNPIGSKSDVEIISEYDRTKKHGGNYKGENDEDYRSITADNSKEVIPSSSEGGVIRSSLRENIPSKKEEEVVIRLSRTNDHYSERSTTRKPQLALSKPKRFNGKIPKKRNRKSNKKITRLTDIVPKPEMFFTDPNLPLAVNMLLESFSLPSEEIDKHTTSSEDSKEGITANEDSNNSKVVEGVEPVTTYNISKTNSKVDDKSYKFTNIRTSPAIVPSAKKPVFIKDPSKRFYFYAPV